MLKGLARLLRQKMRPPNRGDHVNDLLKPQAPAAGVDSARDEPMLDRARKRLGKKARRGFRGYPVATIAVYGPDDTIATKLAVGIVPSEHAEVSDLRRWFSAGADI